MLHTAEIHTKSSDYSSFEKLSIAKNLCYHYPGITLTPFSHGKGEGEMQYKIKAKITPSLTIDPDYLKIYSGKNPGLILDTIDKAFYELELPPVSDWNLCRADFAVDIHTAYAKEYMKILSHGDHKRTPAYKDDSLSIEYSDRGITINFYDKSEEQRAKYGQLAAERAEGILRLEVQAEDKKLTTLFSRYDDNPHRDLPTLLLLDYGDRLVDFVNETVGKELQKIIRLHDHIPKEDAIRKIRTAKGKHNRVLEELEEILLSINRKGNSIGTVRETWCKASGRSTQTFCNRLKEFDKLGINPILAPSKSPEKHFDNLYQLYLTELMNEYKEVA